MRERVIDARKRQYDRYGKEICNSRVPYEVLLNASPMTDAQHESLQQLAIKKNWSNRTQIKIIRLARTISDLQASPAITDQSMSEAIKLRYSANGVRHHPWTNRPICPRGKDREF